MRHGWESEFTDGRKKVLGVGCRSHLTDNVVCGSLAVAVATTLGWWRCSGRVVEVEL